MGHNDHMSNPIRALMHLRPLRQTLIVFVPCLLAGAFAWGEDPDQQNLWMAGPPLLGPTVAGNFDSVAVKDPSIVFLTATGIFFSLPAEPRNTPPATYGRRISRDSEPQRGIRCR